MLSSSAAPRTWTTTCLLDNVEFNIGKVSFKSLAQDTDWTTTPKCIDAVPSQAKSAANSDWHTQTDPRALTTRCARTTQRAWMQVGPSAYQKRSKAQADKPLLGQEHTHEDWIKHPDVSKGSVRAATTQALEGRTRCNGKRHSDQHHCCQDADQDEDTASVA